MPQANRHATRTRTRRLGAVVLVFASMIGAYAVTLLPGPTPDAGIPFETDEVTSTAATQEFSKFQHGSAQHGRMPCLLCHKREVGLTTPRMPGHMPCAGCHVQQFADNTSPMCNICHTPTSVKPFPPLRSFNVRFDHGKHLAQTNCATCHRPSRGGVALSVPAGASAHASCFQCHGPRSEVGGRNIGSCSVCHQPGRPVRGSDSAKAFAVNFSHREHAAKGMTNCSTCHTVRAGVARRRQVASPLASMHFAPAGRQSCASCHNNRRAFGTGDFANCRKCHEGRTFKF